jgi:predicted O-methyltransferase YrrM
MYSPVRLLFKYLSYYFKASNSHGHGIHSPFIFDFITTVLNDKQHYDAYDVVEKLRRDMLNDQTVLIVQDFGAGSTVGHSNKRTVSSIARNAAKPAKYGQLLYRMIKKYDPNIILELGTSLGITTSYLASAKKSTAVISLEGSVEIANVARRNFEKQHLQNVAVVEGNFDTTFTGMVNELYPVDFCFIDGNHRQEPTERYFHQLLQKADINTILVFDDIHWSREMEAAWNTIKTNDKVKCTVDLFFIGIVFFRDEFREKQHFTIRF